MSSKTSAINKPTKRQRREVMARKKEERAVRAEHKKQIKAQSYLADDMNFVSFSQQLSSMGLQLRDIPGDGNCLFRALGDQVDGHGKNHLKYREEVVQYMQQHRNDFEPFVEDDVPFERHVANLRKPGTYAGNDAIVAFAKINKLTVVIHQLNSPPWQIHGSDDEKSKQIHISYHNGDHYSSVRRINDMTGTPTNIKLKVDGTQISGNSKNQNKGKSTQAGSYSSSHYTADTSYTNNHYTSSNHYPASYNQNPYASGNFGNPSGATNYNLNMNDSGEFSWTEKYDADDYEYSTTGSSSNTNGVARAIRDEESMVKQISHHTGCEDIQLIAESLRENYMDVDATVHYILQIMASQPAFSGGHTSMHNSSSHDSGIWSENGSATRIFGSHGTKPKKQSARDVKQQKKMEKKQRATERHKQRLLGNNTMHESGYHENRDDASDDGEAVIVKTVGALTI